MDSYPKTKLYETSLRNGLKPLDTLADWGDFDQFDFKAPWFPQEYFDLVREFRAGMPWNSGCDFEEWRTFYDGILGGWRSCNNLSLEFQTIKISIPD